MMEKIKHPYNIFVMNLIKLRAMNLRVDNDLTVIGEHQGDYENIKFKELNIK